MAFDAEDIQTIKDSLPDRFRPAPSANGLLSSDFLLAGARSAPAPQLGSKQNTAELTLFNLGTAFLNSDPDAAAPSFILAGPQALRANHLAQAGKQEKEDGIDLALESYRNTLRDRLAALNAELAVIDEALRLNEDRRNEIADSMDATQDASDLVASGTTLDVNNPAHRAILERAGINPDDLRGKDRKDQADVIARRRAELARENATLENDWNILMKRRGAVVAEQHNVQGALSDIENADTEEARILAERRAQTVLGAQQLAEAATWTKDQDSKLIAAEAVGSNEADGAKVESLALNRSSVEQNSTEFFQTKSDNPSF